MLVCMAEAFTIKYFRRNVGFGGLGARWTDVFGFGAPRELPDGRSWMLRVLRSSNSRILSHSNQNIRVQPSWATLSLFTPLKGTITIEIPNNSVFAMNGNVFHERPDTKS